MLQGKTNRLAPYPCPGEVLVRRGRLTKLPEVAIKKHREVSMAKIGTTILEKRK
jgi:hypothetical protein